jgi:hypothetical protein
VTIAGSDTGMWDSGLNQLGYVGAYGLYVDRNRTVYVCDVNNYRVMKWLLNATLGIVVAGENGIGSAANKLSWAVGIYVNEVNEIGALYHRRRSH